MARLVVSAAGEAQASSFALAPGQTSIGRGSTNELVLDGNGVSRVHALVSWEADSFRIEDAGSKNGTLLNGEVVAGVTELANGDVVAIPGFTLRFESDEDTVTRSIAGSGRSPKAQARNVLLKPETREVVVRGTTVLLPPKEYLALTLLYEKAGTIVTKEQLADHVWPEYKGDVSDYNIHQVLSRLRRELEEDPAHPRLLITRPGFGYMLAP